MLEYDRKNTQIRTYNLKKGDLVLIRTKEIIPEEMAARPNAALHHRYIVPYIIAEVF